MTHPYYILGADDPEMRAIEDVLSAAGVSYEYATHDGLRVNPRTAYQADQCDPKAVYVECAPEGGIPEGAGQIDHHAPGHPGGSMGPDQSWQASSLGQVMDRLGVPPTRGQIITAAMDHCPAHAFRGECPGVTPDDALEWKVHHIAASTTGGDEAEVWSTLWDAAARLAMSPVTQEFHGHHLPERVVMVEGVAPAGYSLELLASQTAMLRMGIPALMRHADPDGTPKIILTGACSPRLVEEWMEAARAAGATSVYGVPARGFAGCYGLDI